MESRCERGTTHAGDARQRPDQAERVMDPTRAAGNLIQPREWRWTAAVAAAALLLLSPGIFWGLPFGKTVVGADRILAGDVPYRDFWTMYAPGQFYLCAALFRVLGRELWIQAAAVVLIRALTAGALYRLTRRLEAPRPVAICVSLLFVSSQWTTAPEVNSYAPALLFLLIAIERVIAYLQDDHRPSLLIAGALLGLAAWFKHDVAAYVGLAMTLTFCTARRAAREARAAPCLSPLSAITRLAGAAAVVFLPAAAFIAWNAGGAAWHNLFVFPATDFRAVRAESYAPLLPDWDVLGRWAADWRNLYLARAAVQHLGTWILCNAPQYVFVVGLGVLLTRWRSFRSARRAVVVLLLALLPPFWLAAHVQQNTHPYSMAVFSLCLGVVAWGALARAARARRLLRGSLLAVAAVYAAGLASEAGVQVYRMARDSPGGRYLDLPCTRGVRVAEDDYNVYQPIVDFIRRHVPEEERIYVGLRRHDATVITNMRFYYLTQRRNCCRYDELHPGVTDRTDVQREIIAAIEEHGVRCVVLWDFGWAESVLEEIKARNAAGVAGAGSTLLDEYIAANFESLAEYGEYILMWRKDSPRPPAPPPF